MLRYKLTHFTLFAVSTFIQIEIVVYHLNFNLILDPHILHLELSKTLLIIRIDQGSREIPSTAGDKVKITTPRCKIYDKTGVNAKVKESVVTPWA